MEDDACGLWLEADREGAKRWRLGKTAVNASYLNAERCVSSVGLVGVRGLRLVPLSLR